MPHNTLDLGPGTPTFIVLLNADEGPAYLYELPLELSAQDPSLGPTEAVDAAQRALLALLAADYVQVFEERHPTGPSVPLEPGVAERVLADAESWRLPRDRGSAPLHAVATTVAGRVALLTGGAGSSLQ